MKRKNKFWGWFMTVIAVILVGTASWAFYNFINMGVEDLLLSYGIENPYAQSGIVIIGVLILLILFGTGLFKAVDKIIGR